MSTFVPSEVGSSLYILQCCSRLTNEGFHISSKSRCLADPTITDKSASHSSSGTAATRQPDCPICARSHSLVVELRMANERAAREHDVFVQDVRESDDGFRAVAEGFARGVLAYV